MHHNFSDVNCGLHRCRCGDAPESFWMWTQLRGLFRYMNIHPCRWPPSSPYANKSLFWSNYALVRLWWRQWLLIPIAAVSELSPKEQKTRKLALNAEPVVGSYRLMDDLVYWELTEKIEALSASTLILVFAKKPLNLWSNTTFQWFETLIEKSFDKK